MLVDWLPDAVRVPACEYGPSGHCGNGQHSQCAHAVGGPQEAGVRSPSGYVTNRRSQVLQLDGKPAEIGPWHVWRCPCDCHTATEPSVWAPRSKWQQRQPTLKERVERARAEANGRGFAVTFSGPAAEASVAGSVDGMAARPRATSRYRTAVEREAYDYSYDDAYRPARDRRGCTYEEALF